jgi:hypothetical protein
VPTRTDKEIYAEEDGRELVRLYAQHLVKEIKNVPEFQALCDRLAGNQYFGAELDRIRSAKVMVEEWLERPGLVRQEAVREAIKLLLSTRGDDDLSNRCYELIMLGYAPQWSDPQRDAFQAAWKKIQLKNDYFLSFTRRRHAGDPGDNPINTAYKHFIAWAFGGLDRYEKADRSKENLLAVAAHQRLAYKAPRMKGFIFSHTEFDNAFVEKKLADECDRSFVLVQLVQSVMLDRPEGGRRNWCCFEWERFSSRFNDSERERNILFVVAADVPGPGEPGPLDDYFADYRVWQNQIMLKDPPYLPEVPFSNDISVGQIKDVIEKKLVGQIRRAWHQLIVNVPAG